jgi:hypothetical protein
MVVTGVLGKVHGSRDFHNRGYHFATSMSSLKMKSAQGLKQRCVFLVHCDSTIHGITGGLEENLIRIH